MGILMELDQDQEDEDWGQDTDISDAAN